VNFVYVKRNNQHLSFGCSFLDRDPCRYERRPQWSSKPFETQFGLSWVRQRAELSVRMALLGCVEA
jgi:hypothetical protein